MEKNIPTFESFASTVSKIKRFAKEIAYGKKIFISPGPDADVNQIVDYLREVISDYFLSFDSMDWKYMEDEIRKGAEKLIDKEISNFKLKGISKTQIKKMVYSE